MSERWQTIPLAQSSNTIGYGPVRCSIYLEKNDGSPYTGLAYNTSGLTVKRMSSDGSQIANIVLVNAVTVGSVPGNWKFIEINSVEMPGWYRFDIDMNLSIDEYFRFSGAANLNPLIIYKMAWPFNFKSGAPLVTAKDISLSAIGNEIRSNVPSAVLPYFDRVENQIDNAFDTLQSDISKATETPPAMQLPPEEE